MLIDPDSFCNLGHRASIQYNNYTPEVVASDGAINNFSILYTTVNAGVDIPASSIDGTFSLQVDGTPGAVCTLSATRD